jgi:hypothetical protein
MPERVRALVFTFRSWFAALMPLLRTPLDRLSAAALCGLLAGWTLAEALLLAAG